MLLTYLGAGGIGIAGGLVLDYFGLLGTRQDTNSGQLITAAVIFVASGVLFWAGHRVDSGTER